MKISVIGMGYVGSVVAAGLASVGHHVLGIDIDQRKIDSYRKGVVPFYEPGLLELIKAATDHGNLRFLLPNEVHEPLGDAVFIATGTPTGESGGVELGYVRKALSWVKEKQPEGAVVIMKSTVPPGTGLRLCETILRDSPIQYISNPEFLREGQAVNDWFYPDRIVVGANSEAALEIVKELYTGIGAPYVNTDITSAEMIKYAANAFLATKISFVNEIAMLCDRLGATIDDVVDGISRDPRIGPSFLKAGVGYGGSCFPKDARALDDVALHNGHNFELLRSVITVNNRQRLLPLYALREQFGKLSGVSIGILGLAFKPRTDDVRDAPSIDLIRALVDEGAIIKAYDPKVSLDCGLLPESVDIVRDPLTCGEGAQALVLMTEWDEIVSADWEEMAALTKLPRFLFDGRNALNPLSMQNLGFRYCGVGRGKSHLLKVPVGEGF